MLCTCPYPAQNIWQLRGGNGCIRLLHWWGLEPRLGPQDATSYLLHQKVDWSPHNNTTHEHELPSIVVTIKKWPLYVDGKCTRVLTDHSSLIYMATQPHLSPRQVHWMEFLSAYKILFEYLLGKEAIVPDALSHLHTAVLEPGWQTSVLH